MSRASLFSGLAIGLFVSGLAFALVGDPQAGAWLWLASSGAAFLGVLIAGVPG